MTVIFGQEHASTGVWSLVLVCEDACFWSVSQSERTKKEDSPSERESYRTSPSGDLVRLIFAPPPIHLLMTWRVASLSVRYSRLSLSRWDSRHSRSATSSGWFELMSSSSRPTLWECSSLCSLRWAGARCCPVSHPSEDRLQKTAYLCFSRCSSQCLSH